MKLPTEHFNKINMKTLNGSPEKCRFLRYCSLLPNRRNIALSIHPSLSSYMSYYGAEACDDMERSRKLHQLAYTKSHVLHHPLLDVVQFCAAFLKIGPT